MRHTSSSAHQLITGTPKEILHWISTLSMRHPNQMALLLSESLDGLIEREMDVSQRCKVLECAHQQIAKLHTLAIEQLQQNKNALASTQDYYKALERGQQSLVSCYLALMQQDKKKIRLSFRRGHILLSCLTRSMWNLNQIAFRRYLYYKPINSGYWETLHNLFLLAEENKLLDTVITEEHQNKLVKYSIIKLYMSSLLFSLANPAQFQPQDQIILFQQLQDWASFAKLSKQASDSSEFVAALDKDQGAVHRSIHPEIEVGHSMRYLDTMPLLNHLSLLLNRNSQSPNIIPHNLLTRLISAWDKPNVRDFSRMCCPGDIEVVTGLAAAHYVCQNSISNDNSEYPSVIWKVINTSPKGYRISRKNYDFNGVQAGDLACLREPGSTHWQLASIRWIQQEDSNEAQMGIQLLAPKAEAVAIKLQAKQSDLAEQLALVIPEFHSLNHKRSIITTNPALAAGSELILVDPKGECKIRLLEQLQSHRRFGHFVYSTTE